MDEKSLRNAQGFAKFQRVQTISRLIHNDHDVVSRLIIDHQLAVTIPNQTTRRILYLLLKGIGVCGLLVVITQQLQDEKADDIDDHDDHGHSSYYQTAV